MKRAYTRPAMSPNCRPWGTDVSALAWMDREGMGPCEAPSLWAALGEALDLLADAETLRWQDADGEWRV